MGSSQQPKNNPGVSQVVVFPVLVAVWLGVLVDEDVVISSSSHPNQPGVLHVALVDVGVMVVFDVDVGVGRAVVVVTVTLTSLLHPNQPGLAQLVVV